MERRQIADAVGRSRGDAGRSQVEVLLVFVLLLLLGVSAFTLTLAGGDSYKRLNGYRDADSAARIALAYTEMKIHQYDSAGALTVVPHPVTGEPSLLIRETIEGVRYETWIYHKDGMLMEALVTEGQVPDEPYGFAVTELETYDLEPDPSGQGVTVLTAQTDEEGRRVELKSFVAFRSGGVRP